MVLPEIYNGLAVVKDFRVKLSPSNVVDKPDELSCIEGADLALLKVTDVIQGTVSIDMEEIAASLFVSITGTDTKGNGRCGSEKWSYICNGNWPVQI